MTRCRPWTHRDNNVLEHVYTRIPLCVISFRLGRTIQAIYNQVSKLDLNKTSSDPFLSIVERQRRAGYLEEI